MNSRTKLGKYLVQSIGGELDSEIINLPSRESRYALTQVPLTNETEVKKKIRSFYADKKVDIVEDYDSGFDFEDLEGNLWDCVISYFPNLNRCMVTIQGV
jgi:hypothetical protein